MPPRAARVPPLGRGALSGARCTTSAIDAPARIDERALERSRRAFEREYERLFGPGSALNDAGIELVNYGVDAIGAIDKPPFARAAAGAQGRRRAPSARRGARRRGEMVPTPIYDGPSLRARRRDRRVRR